MKKLMMVLAAVVAGCAFADRTANREWVERNFAPSNVVPRVEAVEDTLTNGTRIAIGKGASVDEADGVSIGQNALSMWDSIGIGANAQGQGCESVAIGKGSLATDDNSVAIGHGAVSYGPNAVQLGAGENDEDGTLQFRDWTVVGSDGKIPKERITESDSAFELWRTNSTKIAVGRETVASASASTAVGPYSTASGACSVALGAESEATAAYAVQLGAGRNSTFGSLQFGEWMLLDEFGKIPTARLPEVQPGSCIPKEADQRVVVGPLVLGAEPVLLGLGVYSVGDPWSKSTWGIDSSSMYTEADWHFGDTVYIGPDGLAVYGLNHFNFIINNRWVSFAESVKEQITPAVVLEKIKAMNDTQKAELKAFLGIQ